MIYEKVLEEKIRLEKQVQYLQSQIEELPLGKLICASNRKWKNETYDKSENHPEHLIHKTYSGNYVRSKSEALIDMFLFKNKIPFRYECPLELDNVILYPDFTIRHPKTGDLFSVILLLGIKNIYDVVAIENWV